ncbi:unnamed protein product [Ranitomeya imitator]|uniref:Uncharacterized protein n=1 Tax=Ranitomeya imitator TaxID=111125 RepID=A0ABN9M694_9NEOB|nr:unnamed protein product [Ranitomeya imitator]
MFKKRKENAEEVVEVPCWTAAPYNILAQELVNSGLAEQWSSKLKGSEPTDVVEVLRGVPVKAGDAVSLGRRTWILFSAYRIMHERNLQMQKKRSQLEQKVVELGGQKVVLDCNTRLLKDKLEHYQGVAEKAAIKVAQNKYRKRKGKINKEKVPYILEYKPRFSAQIFGLKVPLSAYTRVKPPGAAPSSRRLHLPGVCALTVQVRGRDDAYSVRGALCLISQRRDAGKMEAPERDAGSCNQESIAAASVNWDPDLWDGDVWDTSSSDDWEDPPAPVIDPPKGSSKLKANPIQRRMEHDGQPIMVERGVPHTRTRILTEDYTQNEVDSILTQFKQKPEKQKLHDPVIQRYFTNYFRENEHDQLQNIVMIVARAVLDKYPTETDIPVNDKPWYILRDGIERLKEEAMRSALSVLAVEEEYIDYPMTASMRSRLVKTALPHTRL